MRKLRYLLLILLMLPCQSLPALEVKSGVIDGNAPAPFKIPNELTPLLKGYRKHWRRMTNPEQSGLHWNQGIIVYMNKGHKIYANNHEKYIKSLSEESDSSEAKNTFLTYPVGTILIKENYFVEDGVITVPASIAMMIKREKNYDNSTGDWQFVQFDPAGRIMVNGNSKNTAVATACTQCHQGIAVRDHVFSTHFANPAGRK